VEFPVDKGLSRTSVIRIVILAVIAAGLAAGIYFAPAFFIKKEDPAPAKLKLGGTSVASMIVENRWMAAFRAAKNVEVEFDSTGSTAGVNKVIDRGYAIGFTHAPLNEEQRKKALAQGGEIVQVPVVICAVVPAYNVKELKGKPPLKLNGEVLAGIFLGKITTWNHPAIQELNKGVELPPTKITVVHREDSSGTTFLFTDYLQGASPTWKAQFGAAASELKWPVGVAKPRNQGVAEFVRKTEGAIGYIDLVHAAGSDNDDLDYAALENKDKTAFLHADATNMAAAAKAAAGGLSDDPKFSLTNAAGSDCYPISGFIWAVCYSNQPAAQHQMVADFLHWITHDGQQFAPRTSYAALPPEVVLKVEERLKSIKAAN
jgi:phosphate transport system substrate-binding protein